MTDAISRELLTALAKKGRVEALCTLRAYPDRDFTINELARSARIPAMTAWRAVRDLRAVGMARTRRIGNAVCVRLTDDKDKLRVLRLIPDSDPYRCAAKEFAARLGAEAWLLECRLFGTVGRGEHLPGEEVDVAIVYDQNMVSEMQAKQRSTELALRIKEETNITIVPFCISHGEMSRRGGLAAELRDREVIWKR